ncbi:MAG TPA: nitroreductase family protein [Acidimicrobiales bacterium]|nr:nitroreductase family protein [Acidimicrobiales bacterium]
MRELADIIRHRHSERVAFDPARPIPPGDLDQILEAARWAPTAHNMQNYEMIVVDDPRRLEEIGRIRSEISEVFVRENYAQLSFSEEELLAKKTGILAAVFPPSWLTPNPDPAEISDPEHAYLGAALRSAPVLLLVVHDSTRRAPASEGDVLGFMSLGCVMENMWLTAESLGIGMQILSAMSGTQVEEELHRILEVPASVKVAFGARLGYPLEQPGQRLRVRRDVVDFAHRNSYSAPYRS